MSDQVEPGIYTIDEPGKFSAGFHGYQPVYIQVKEDGTACVLGRGIYLQQMRQPGEPAKRVPQEQLRIKPVKDEDGNLALPPSNWRSMLKEKVHPRDLPFDIETC